MSLRQMSHQIEDMLVGIEVQQAVDATVAYIRYTRRFQGGPQAAYSYWSGLSDIERANVLAAALRWDKTR